MRLVVFGLTVSSSWGNGHATLWRGLIAALHDAGHHVTFFERDVPYYAQNRDLYDLPHGELVLYSEWDEMLPTARRVLARADAVIVTSFCPDGRQATRLLADTRVTRLFYDLDTPVTLARVAAGEAHEFGPDLLAPFDLVLSYTGGPAIEALRTQLHARRVVPLYGWVDAERYRPAAPRGDVSGAAMTYLGTYAGDRQDALTRLLVEPARQRPDRRFVIGGAQYPDKFPWGPNIWFLRHVPPEAHPAFYAAGRLTLNVTRAAMAAMGWCPSGRLFEAAACGTPIVTDDWPGLDAFFTPGEDILVATSTADSLAAIDLPDATLAAIAARAQARVLDQHTARHRARTLADAIENATLRQEA